jgi:anaerobic selenocysteine-containing dehydrogenase
MIETRKSFCRFCHVFCGVEVDTEDDRVIAVRGDRENAASEGYTCPKGRAESERIHHPDRILRPRKRDGESWSEISPDDALDEIGAKLRAIIDEHGPESVAVYVGCGGHRTSTGGPWYVRKWLNGIGSPGLYTSLTIDSPSLFLAGHRFFGSPVACNLFDIDNADVAMFVATNPTVSHMMVMPQPNPTKRLNDAQQRGMKLIVVDPRRSDVARRADIHLQLKPGEDATLLAGMIKLIIERKLYDAAYVAECVSGVDDLLEAVRDFDLEYVAQRTQVPADKIAQAAELLASSRTGAAQSGTGLHMARHQNLTTQLVMVLNGLCGRYDRKGGIARNKGVLGIDIPEGIGPAPFPHFVGPTSRIRGIRGTFGLIGFYEEMPTSTLTDEILTPGKGQIRALIVNGGNPALVFSNEKKTQRALQDLDLLVVNDLFESATARHADYILPVKHPFERVDVPRLADVSFPFPFSQYAAPLVSAPEETLEEWEIFWELATRLGTEIAIPGISMDQKPTADELLDGLHAHSRIPLDEVRKYPGGHVWGERELTHGGMIPNMIGHADHKMAAGHPEVIAELREVRAESTIETGGYEQDADYGFRMITYRMKESYCTQGQNLPSLRNKRKFNPVLMNPESLAALPAKSGDIVVIENRFGHTEGVVEASDDIAPGVIAVAHGWGDPNDARDVREKGCNVQRLIPADEYYDKITGLALQSAIPVNVSARPN